MLGIAVVIRWQGFFKPAFTITHSKMQGDVSAVRALLQQGAEPNAKDNAGWTPLVWYDIYM